MTRHEMIRSVRATLTLLLFIVPFEAGAATSRLALIIGNNIGSNGLTNLRYAEQDARNLQKTLIQIGGFPENQTRILLGKGPEAVRRAIKSLQSQALHLMKNRSDQLLLLVFFSGHAEGGIFEFGPTPFDSQEFHDEIEKIPSTTRILIFDACQSGDLIRPKGGISIPPLSIHSDDSRIPEGEIVITSSTGIEESLESESLQGSIFTHFLISGLRGGADFNLDGKVSLSEVTSYAGELTSYRASRHQRSQQPRFEFNLSGSGEIFLTDIGRGAPLLSLPSSEEGIFLISHRKSGNIVTEIEKSVGTSRWIALPEGEILVRKKRNGYFLEQAFLTQMGRLYQFNEEKGRKVRIHAARRIVSYDAPERKTGSVLLREGEIVNLGLLETISTKTSQEGDKIRMESIEDLYVDGRLVIAAGAPANGEILGIREKRGLVHGELVLRMGYVQAVDGQWVRLESIISRYPAGLRILHEGDDVFTEAGSETETDIASGITAFFFLPFYPFIKGRHAVLEEGTLFEAYVAKDVRIR